jgi:hypothetical protein
MDPEGNGGSCEVGMTTAGDDLREDPCDEGDGSIDWGELQRKESVEIEL